MEFRLTKEQCRTWADCYMGATSEYRQVWRLSSEAPVSVNLVIQEGDDYILEWATGSVRMVYKRREKLRRILTKDQYKTFLKETL